MTFNVYVGYDPREIDAYAVCVKSLSEKATCKLRIHTLMRRHLEAMGLYKRKYYVENGQMYDSIDKKPFSTEFSFTRFLVPELNHFGGWALFVDCDFMFRADISELLALADPRYAVMVVKHDHEPVDEKVKMDGVLQTRYSRKNWSSLILWNCSHPSNERITRQRVNGNTGWWLHNFCWLNDEEIGGLPLEWNWLSGYSPPEIEPKAVHYTSGGPWFADYQDVPYAQEWKQTLERIQIMRREEITRKRLSEIKGFIYGDFIDPRKRLDQATEILKELVDFIEHNKILERI